MTSAPLWWSIILGVRGCAFGMVTRELGYVRFVKLLLLGRTLRVQHSTRGLEAQRCRVCVVNDGTGC